MKAAVELGVRVVPPEPGTFTLPSLEIALGDPTSPALLRTDPVEIVVAPPPSPAERLGDAPPSPGLAPPPKRTGIPRYVLLVAGLLGLIGVAAIVAAVLAIRYRDAEKETRGVAGAPHAVLRASAENPDEALYREGATALRARLARPGDSGEALTSAEILDRARAAGLSPEGRAALERFLEAADAVRYGGAIPNLDARNQDLARIIYVLDELEDRTRRGSAAGSP